MGLALGTLCLSSRVPSSAPLSLPGRARPCQLCCHQPRALLWCWQNVPGMFVPSSLETTSLVLAEKHISSVGMARAAEVQCQTGWGGLAGCGGVTQPSSECSRECWEAGKVEEEEEGCSQQRGRRLSRRNLCAGRPWATEPGENNRGGHEAEPQGTWALKLNLITHHFTRA